MSDADFNISLSMRTSPGVLFLSHLMASLSSEIVIGLLVHELRLALFSFSII